MQRTLTHAPTQPPKRLQPPPPTPSADLVRRPPFTSLARLAILHILHTTLISFYTIPNPRTRIVGTHHSRTHRIHHQALAPPFRRPNLAWRALPSISSLRTTTPHLPASPRHCRPPPRPHPKSRLSLCHPSRGKSFSSSSYRVRFACSLGTTRPSTTASSHVALALPSTITPYALRPSHPPRPRIGTRLCRIKYVYFARPLPTALQAAVAAASRTIYRLAPTLYTTIKPQENLQSSVRQVRYVVEA